MHKVCDIRDLGVRARLAPREMWAAYVRDLDSLLDRSMEGSIPCAPAMERERAAA